LFDAHRDFTGNETARTPEFSGNLGLVWAHDLGTVGELEFGAEYYYNSGSFYTAQNDEEVAAEDRYDILNARLSYFYEPWGLRLTAFGRNLENTKYDAAFNQMDFGTIRTLGEPRHFGLKLNYTY
jgi:iron complex outermembrane receptor protein